MYHVNAGSCLHVITRTVDSPSHPDPWSLSRSTTCTTAARVEFLTLSTASTMREFRWAHRHPATRQQVDKGRYGISSRHSHHLQVLHSLTPLFVVGDLEPHSAISANVYFWGSQWWKYNSLGASAATGLPRSKATPAAPTTSGGTRTSRVGNSPPPPDGIPEAHLAIIIDDESREIEVRLTGDTRKILIVHPDDSYSSSPGHGVGSGYDDQLQWAVIARPQRSERLVRFNWPRARRRRCSGPGSLSR